MKPLDMPVLTAEQLDAVAKLYRTTHNELFQTVKSLLAAARDFFDRYNREPTRTLSVIGSHAQNVI